MKLQRTLQGKADYNTEEERKTQRKGCSNLPRREDPTEVNRCANSFLPASAVSLAATATSSSSLSFLAASFDEAAVSASA